MSDPYHYDYLLLEYFMVRFIIYKPNSTFLFQIYFTRNGNVIGKKDIRIPKGGFYPTVGMMSCDEKVRVDLRPLSG